MTNRNESVHERLNRELWRARFRSRRNWLNALALVGVVVLIVLATVRIPSEVSHHRGVMEEVMPLISEDGPLQVLTVRIDGDLVLAHTRAAILHPVRGQEVCVRRTREMFTGRRTVALADPRHCAGE